jgi:hypothetical protein
MRLFFRTRAQKRRANRRLAGSLFASMFVVTLLFAAAMAGRYLLGLWR